MKKNIIFLILITILSPCIFAKDFFSERYFEVNVTMPVSVSNNAMSVKDFFQEELMIDLRKIADALPSTGFNTILKTSPNYTLNLRLPKLHVGFSSGLDFYEKFSISKDLFNFLGYGNQIGEEISVALENNTDVFFHTDVTLESKIKDSKLTIKPSLFIPLITSSGEIGKMSFVNNADGSIHMELNSNAIIYSYFDITNLSTDNLGDGSGLNLDPEILTNSGFDMDLSFMKPVSSEISLGFNIHFPIIPGKITNFVRYGYSYSIDTSVTNISEIETDSNYESEFSTDAMVKVNRPFKIFGMLNYVPFDSIFLYELGFGFAIRHPFVEGTYTYPEYYFGSSFHIGGGLFEAKLSTEYMDEVFKHQLQTKLNLRIYELDLGFSLESSSFVKSFSTAGFGAFASVSIGF